MSPFIVAADPRFLDRGSGDAIATSGRRLQELGITFHKLKEQRDRERAETILANERLDLERQRAEIQLMREERMASLQEQKAGEREADREAVQTGFGELQQTAETNAGQQGFQQAMGAPGAVDLGPFGLLGAAGAGAAAQAQARQRMEGHKALAARMSPEAARGYLARETVNEEKALRAQGFDEEKRMLQKAADPETGDGYLSPEESKLLESALRTEIASGRPPGQITKRLQVRYAQVEKTRLRDEEWVGADGQAEEMIAAIGGATMNAPKGINPLTGKSAQAEMAGRLAKAKAEWEKTKHKSYRISHGPAESLEALQAVLYGAEAEADPAGFAHRAQAEATDQAGRHARGEAPFRPLEQRGTAAGGGGAATAAAPPKKAGGPKRTDEERLAGQVQRGAQEALRAGPGPQRKARIKELLNQIADALGLDPEHPVVLERVREALQAAHAPQR
jgi:hypothetical protein